MKVLVQLGPDPGKVAEAAAAVAGLPAMFDVGALRHTTGFISQCWVSELRLTRTI